MPEGWIKEVFDGLKWLVIFLLGLIVQVVRSENRRLTTRLDEVERGQSAFREEVAKEYVRQADLQLHVQRQSEEVRAVRTEIANLREGLLEQMNRMRHDIVELLRLGLGVERGKD